MGLFLYFGEKPGMPLQYHKCNTSNLDVLVDIAKETFVAAFKKDNNPEDFNDYVQKAFDPERMLAELKNSNSHFYLVYESDDLVGYFKLNIGKAQTDVHDEDALEIERIYVLGAYQGRKFGSQMLDRIVHLARQMGKRYIWLGVWEQNPGAIRFYQRHGYKKFGEHAYFIGQDKQTDWLMRLHVY